MFLAQVLAPGCPCREILRVFLGLLALEGKTASARTTGYCKARAKLPPRALEEVRARQARRIRQAHAPDALWRGRAVKVVDGTGLSMPDTAANRKAWPQPAGAKKGCSFPVMRLVAIFCLGTGVLVHWTHGSLKVSERALFRALWKDLDGGDVILADRGFCGFAEYYFLLGRGVDCVMRNHQRRKSGQNVQKVFGPGDRLIVWRKAPQAPDWVGKRRWKRVPDWMLLREIEFQVAARGFRVRRIVLATTLLDPVAYPAEEVADLYRRRWQVELFLRDIKTTLDMDVLRCLSPAMVRREVTMHWIGYNLIRLTILQAAQAYGAPVERISFKGAADSLRAWAPLLAQAGRARRRCLWRMLLHYLAQDLVPLRPHRVEPRARKRRPKNYQLLNQPRRFFKEIYHRNKYTKMLS